MNISFYRALVCICIFSLTFNAQSITLSEAIENSLKFDPTLQASKLNLLAAEENIAIARSRLLPQVSLQGSSSQITQTTTQDVVGGGNVSRSFTGPSINHQLVVRQTLFRPKDLSALTYAELQTQLMTVKYKVDVLDLKTKVVNAWIDVLGSRQIAKAYEKPLDVAKKSVAQEQAKYRKGESTKDAVIEAEAQYQNAIAMWQQSVLTMKDKLSFFERLTKLSADSLNIQEISLMPVDMLEQEEKNAVWENLVEASLELKISKLQEKIQFEKIVNSTADHKPTLDLITAVNIAKNDVTSTQGYQYRNKQIGFQYYIPLYAGGSVIAAVNQANLAYEASLAESEAQYARFENDFNNNWNMYFSFGLKQKAMYFLVESSKVALKANQRNFELGVKSISDVAIAEINLAKKLVEHIGLTQDFYRYCFKLNKLNFE